MKITLLAVASMVCALRPALVRAQSADEIMARVAENQTRTEAARASFVYQQDVLVRLQRSNGKLAREEDREYTVTPEPDGIKREMVHFRGEVRSGTARNFPSPNRANIIRTQISMLTLPTAWRTISAAIKIRATASTGTCSR